MFLWTFTGTLTQVTRNLQTGYKEFYGLRPIKYNRLHRLHMLQLYVRELQNPLNIVVTCVTCYIFQTTVPCFAL